MRRKMQINNKVESSWLDFFSLKINNFGLRILNFEFIFCTFAPENPESVGLRLLIN